MFESLLIMKRANEESEKKSTRVADSWVGRRLKGTRGSVCPSWLRLGENGRYEEIPDRAKIVREIFDLAAGGMAAYTISRLLNARFAAGDIAYEPFKNTVAKKGKAWHPTTIMNLLTNKAVLGIYEPGKVEDGKKVKLGEAIDGWYPAVIEESMWAKVQAGRRTNKRGRKGAAMTNLFSGRVHCAWCSGVMKVRNFGRSSREKEGSGKRHYYVCTTAAQNRGCDASFYFGLEALESAILDHVSEYRLSELFAQPETGSELRRVENEIAATQMKIEGLEKGRSRLMKRIKEADDDDPLIAEYEKELRAEIIAIGKEQAALKAQEHRRISIVAQKDSRADIEARIMKLRAELANADDATRLTIRTRLSAALRTFIDDMRFDPATGTIDVILLGGMAAYRFKQSRLKGRNGGHRVDLIDHFSLVPLVQTGQMRKEPFLSVGRMVDGVVEMVEVPRRAEVFEKIVRGH
ncbi:recombinase family protein [Microvirga soli]|uniref:recombinase family protein n=1 Tax=Microvirga soli TaxID=1854496 RepID=UPI0035E40942